MKLSRFSLVLAAAGLSLFSCRKTQEIPPTPVSPSPVETPATDPEQTPEVADREYLDLTEADASAKAEAAGLKWRVIERDGQPQPATMDLNPQRLNFAVSQGKVIRVTRG